MWPIKDQPHDKSPLSLPAVNRRGFSGDGVIGIGGGLVWLFGSTAIHIGASGLIFGWFGFLVARGLVDRSLVTLGAALLTGFLYGSILWGVLPGQPGVSWEGHLFGAIAGAVAALLIRTHVHAPRLSGVDQM